MAAGVELEVAEPAQGDDDPPRLVRTDGPAAMLESIVVRVAAEVGVAVDDVRRHGAEIHRGFAGARIHNFVPILIEKRLREHFRRLRGTA